ncbi:hypothetical protein AB205_0004940, partial [Aquarana catesbeiana]
VLTIIYFYLFAVLCSVLLWESGNSLPFGFCSRALLYSNQVPFPRIPRRLSGQSFGLSTGPSIRVLLGGAAQSALCQLTISLSSLVFSITSVSILSELLWSPSRQQHFSNCF